MDPSSSLTLLLSMLIHFMVMPLEISSLCGYPSFLHLSSSFLLNRPLMVWWIMNIGTRGGWQKNTNVDINKALAAHSRWQEGWLALVNTQIMFWLCLPPVWVLEWIMSDMVLLVWKYLDIRSHADGHSSDNFYILSKMFGGNWADSSEEFRISSINTK